MANFTFTLLIDGPDLQSDENLEALFEAGCDDATIGSRDHIQYADFDREAATLAEAIASAIRDVQTAVPNARVLRVEPEEFVSLTAIAQRTERSREYIRLLAEGERGPGGFPSPVRWIDARTRVWRWGDVAEWFETSMGTTPPRGHVDIDVIVMFNSLLEARFHAGRLSRQRDRQILSEFVREDDELRDLLGV
jgi:hypothetical protein